MGDTTKISWTTHTSNPWVGCVKVSEACTHCYAEVSTPARTSRAKGLELWGPAKTTARTRTGVSNRNRPLKWNRDAAQAGTRAQVFCASLADVFEDHPSLPPWRADLWKMVEATPWLDWQLLTKRPENIPAMVPPTWLTNPPDNVWYGTTVENQARAEERIPRLMEVPARVRFLSMEPLLEPVTFRDEWLKSLSWLIIGGESGSHARPFAVSWVRDLIRLGRDYNVDVWVKQMGSWPTTALSQALHRDPSYRLKLVDGHGADPNEWDEDLRVQQMPRTALPRTLPKVAV